MLGLGPEVGTRRRGATLPTDFLHDYEAERHPHDAPGKSGSQRRAAGRSRGLRPADRKPTKVYREAGNYQDMATLREQLGSGDKRNAVIEDALKVLDQEVDDRGGITGLAIKGAYKVV